MTGEQGQQRGFSLGDLRFYKILATVEQELQTALAKARLESDHGPSIGDGAEEPVRSVLRSYLPRVMASARATCTTLTVTDRVKPTSS